MLSCLCFGKEGYILVKTIVCTYVDCVVDLISDHCLSSSKCMFGVYCDVYVQRILRVARFLMFLTCFWIFSSVFECFWYYLFLRIFLGISSSQF